MNINNISSLNAYKMLIFDHNAIMIDVRSIYEWQNVGVPKITNNQLIFFSSELLFMILSNKNLKKLLILHDVGISTNLLFICRSGIRSMKATTIFQSLGYLKCYNVVDGFEGSNYGIGWKKNNLPYGNFCEY